MSNLSRHILSQAHHRASNYTDRSPKPSESSKFSSFINNEPTNTFHYMNNNEKPNSRTGSRSPKPAMRSGDSRSKSPYSAQRFQPVVQEKAMSGFSRVSVTELQEASDSLKKLKEKMKNFGAKTPTKRVDRVHTMNDEVENLRNTRGFDVNKNSPWRERIKTPEKSVQKPLIQANDFENQGKRTVFKSPVDNSAAIQSQKAAKEYKSPPIITPMNASSDKKGRITPSTLDKEPTESVLYNRRQSKSPINSRNNTIIRTENRSRSPIGEDRMNIRREDHEHIALRRESKSPVNGDRSMVVTPLQFKPERPARIESLFDHNSSKFQVDTSDNSQSNMFEVINRSSRRENLMQKHYQQSKSRERSPMNETKSTAKPQFQYIQSKSPVSKSQSRFFENPFDNLEQQSRRINTEKSRLIDVSNDNISQYENMNRSSRRENLMQKDYIASKSRERSPINETRLSSKVHPKMDNSASSPDSKSQTSFFKNKIDFVEHKSDNKAEPIINNHKDNTDKIEDIRDMNPLLKPNLQRGAFSKPSFKPKTITILPKKEEVKVEVRIETLPKENVLNTENEMPAESEPLVECPQGCGRRFLADVLPKHAKICVTVFQSKRRQFDTASQRLTDDQANLLDNKSSIKPNKNKKKMNEVAKAGEKQPKWKQQSDAFRANLKASRGEKLTKEEEMVRNNNDDLIQCEYCMRRFNEQAAQRHITFCKNKHKLEAVKRSSKINSKK